ncbi:unnamed protein product, partial [Ilex paraguariensis]
DVGDAQVSSLLFQWNDKLRNLCHGSGSLLTRWLIVDHACNFVRLLGLSIINSNSFPAPVSLQLQSKVIRRPNDKLFPNAIMAVNYPYDMALGVIAVVVFIICVLVRRKKPSPAESQLDDTDPSIWNEKNLLLLGIRCAIRPQTVILYMDTITGIGNLDPVRGQILTGNPSSVIAVVVFIICVLVRRKKPSPAESQLDDTDPSIWNEKNQLLLGIRCAIRPQTVMLYMDTITGIGNIDPVRGQILTGNPSR